MTTVPDAQTYRIVVHHRGERRLLKSGQGLSLEQAQAMKESMSWDWRLAFVHVEIEEEN